MLYCACVQKIVLTCWHSHTSLACGTGDFRLKLFPLRSPLLRIDVDPCLTACWVVCYVWFIEPVLKQSLLSVSPPGILLVVITSDRASAVFDIDILLYCIMLLYSLYYAAVCLYCALYAPIMLLYARTMLLYAHIMLLYSRIMLLYALIMLLYACIMLLYACIMLLYDCIMLLYACIMLLYA